MIVDTHIDALDVIPFVFSEPRPAGHAHGGTKNCYSVHSRAVRWYAVFLDRVEYY